MITGPLDLSPSFKQYLRALEGDLFWHSVMGAGALPVRTLTGFHVGLP